jgi:hypothetical protein
VLRRPQPISPARTRPAPTGPAVGPYGPIWPQPAPAAARTLAGVRHHHAAGRPSQLRHDLSLSCPLETPATSPLSPSRASLLLALRRPSAECRRRHRSQAPQRRFAGRGSHRGKPSPPRAPRRRAAPSPPLPVAS